MEDKRGNLPKVPACDRCNNEKSKLEHYLTAVLPFGGKHNDSVANLRSMVPGRLAKNLRLQRELAAGYAPAVLQESSAHAVPALTIPFDGSILEQLFHFITRALAFHHWDVQIDAHHDARVVTLTQTGQEAFALFLNMGAKRRVEATLGKGTFSYQGMQGDVPELTVWRFSIYGGLTLAGDVVAPGDVVASSDVVSGIGAITASREFLSRPNVAKVFRPVVSSNTAS
jgi:hypothetical protein